MLKLTTSQNDLITASNLLKNSETVAIPTETVYGLAANALDKNAVEKIFKAKNRPADNPLIIHISDISDFEKYCFPSKTAIKLAEKFWAGPLTLICKKKPIIPDIVTAGLSCVAVRVPANEIARKIISLCGFPLAAPSANISGKPSPTTANHVISDFDGNPFVSAVVDGGGCVGGVESTVLDMTTEIPCLLRPGLVTKEDLSEILPNLTVADAVLSQLSENEAALSPGLRHKHYAPEAETFCLFGKNADQFFVDNKPENSVVICFDEEFDMFLNQGVKAIKYGSCKNSEKLAENLFSALREADKLKPKRIYIRFFSTEGVGLAVYNRIIRSANFKIINTEGGLV